MTAWEIVVTCIFCTLAGFAAGGALAARLQAAQASSVRRRLSKAFRPHDITVLAVSERSFPARIRAELQLALDAYFANTTVIHQCGVRIESDFFGIDLPYLLTKDAQAWESPLQNEEVSIGPDHPPVHCPRNSLWIARDGDTVLALLLSKAQRYTEPPRMMVHIATCNDQAGREKASQLFAHLEASVKRATAYRGKVLSLESSENYSGEGSGVRVHSVPTVTRESVILAAETLELVDRNVLEFVAHRQSLRDLGQSTKKGVLFYGPPGNGKTLTIRWLISALPDHTTILINGAQIAQLSEYMELARLLQPALVVVEDIDLIARARQNNGMSCEEPLLNQLLNEMDGLEPASDIIFLLTTNRPEILEEALASRPGRVDQAIPFGLPTDTERAALARLYAGGVELTEDVIRELIGSTRGASAAFIKELMRRTIQCCLARQGDTAINPSDVQIAVGEMVYQRNELNAKILGFSASVPTAEEDSLAASCQQRTG